MDTGLHKGIILRLAKYLRVVRQLKSLGFVKVFSHNLGDAIGVIAVPDEAASRSSTR